MNERRVLDPYREAGEVPPLRNSRLTATLRRAALAIAQEAETDQRHSARAASIARLRRHPRENAVVKRSVK